MMDERMIDVIIIGSGPVGLQAKAVGEGFVAGREAALYVRKMKKEKTTG